MQTVQPATQYLVALQYRSRSGSSTIHRVVATNGKSKLSEQSWKSEPREAAIQCEWIASRHSL
jgi:hypothetical protein